MPLTLKKAVKIGTNFGSDNNLGLDNEEIDAIRLLVEAGKDILAHRPRKRGTVYTLLPGESPE